MINRDNQFHFLALGCLKPYFYKFAADLGAARYTSFSISNYRDSVAHFGTWIDRKGITIGDFKEEVLTTFAEHYCECPGGRRGKRLSRRYVARVRRFLCYLHQQGIIENAPPEKIKDEHPVLVREFDDWMRCHRGISPRTLERYDHLIIVLLRKLGNDPKQYDTAEIRKVIEAVAKQHSRATAQGFATALRAYLRFLSANGHCRSSLEAAVPTFPQWKLSALPRYLSIEEFERVIATCDRRTPCSLRDHAILLLLSRLGLRGGDIVNMRLEDVDWTEGTLRVHGKGRREVRLPLPQDAGDALLAYLEQVRPPVPIEHIFLCMNAPCRAFSSSAVVSGIVRGALARAGIANPPSYGANLLRHSAATSMLRAGASLDAVSAVLRHRWLDTTAHYAKVDIGMLRPIAQPWPGDDSC